MEDIKRLTDFKDDQEWDLIIEYIMTVQFKLRRDDDLTAYYEYCVHIMLIQIKKNFLCSFL